MDRKDLQAARSQVGPARHQLVEHWPSWRLALVELDDQSELFDFDSQTIFIDLRHWPEGPMFAVRHAITHLDWDHVSEPGPFTHKQCDVADDVARLHTQEQAWVM